MAYYRLYVLNGEGSVIGRIGVHCENDESALAQAKQRNSDYRIEVWDEARLVGVVKAEIKT